MRLLLLLQHITSTRVFSAQSIPCTEQQRERRGARFDDLGKTEEHPVFCMRVRKALNCSGYVNTKKMKYEYLVPEPASSSQSCRNLQRTFSPTESTGRRRRFNCLLRCVVSWALRAVASVVMSCLRQSCYHDITMKCGEFRKHGSSIPWNILCKKGIGERVWWWWVGLS